MKPLPPCLSGCALLLALAVSAPARGEPPAAAGPPRDGGTQLFRGLLHHYKVAPVPIGRPGVGPDPLEDVRFQNKNVLIVVYGDPGRRTKAVATLVRNTLAKGGAVLIAADSFLNLSPFFPDGEDLEIVGNTVTDPGGANSYAGQRTCPFVKPYALGRGEPKLGEELFAGFDRLATNSPSALRISKRPPYLGRTVALFPDTAQFTGGKLTIPLGRTDSFAAAGIGTGRETYRCLVMANAAVLSNDMLYSSADPEPTDNFAFVVKLVPWLQGPEKRKSCLFIENGVVQDRFDEFDFAQVPATEPPKPKMPPIPAPRLPDPMDRKFQEGASKFASEVATRIEDNDSFKNALARDTRAYVAVVGTLFVMAMILASILLRRRVWGSGMARNYQPIPADPLRLGRDAALGSFAHRRLEILRGSDFRAPFAEFVKLLFHERGYPEGYRGDRCPKIEAEGRSRAHLLDSVRRLWTEAHLHADAPLAYTKWKELEPILAAVRSAAVANRWRFAPGPVLRTDSEGSA